MSQKAKRSSMGFISILTLILIVLKLTGLVSFATILITGKIKKGKW